MFLVLYYTRIVIDVVITKAILSNAYNWSGGLWGERYLIQSVSCDFDYSFSLKIIVINYTKNTLVFIGVNKSLMVIYYDRIGRIDCEAIYHKT